MCLRIWRRDIPFSSWSLYQTASAPKRPRSLGRPLHRRSNVLVMTKQVRRVVLVLHADKPVVICPEGGLDSLRTLLSLNANLVDVVAAGGEWTHHFRKLARPLDVNVVRRRLQPARNTGPLAQRLTMAKGRCGSTDPVRSITQLLKDDDRQGRRDGGRALD